MTAELLAVLGQGEDKDLDPLVGEGLHHGLVLRHQHWIQDHPNILLC